MAVADKLQEQGWHLSEEGINLIGENGSITDIRSLIRRALDFDLREISVPSFPEDVNKGKVDFIPGRIVVQIQKIRNISAPKANEDSRAAPRMLKLSLTDGQMSCQAIETETIQSISLNTPPGTKLFLKSEVPVTHGMILLKPSDVEVLGGTVAHLVEKWELNRSLAKHTRGRIGEEGGPPPWIPFGEKILRSNPQDRNFKSLESMKDKENRENAEFEAQRKDAIAEAARGGAKKVFGGGNKPLLDYNVQQIVDYGFSVEQAEYALRQNRNNVDRALRTLQVDIQDIVTETNDELEMLQNSESENVVKPSESVSSASENRNSKKRAIEEQRVSRSEEAYQILKDSCSKDDCSVFGDYVACELRKLDSREKIIAKHLINNVLFDLNIGKYSNTVVVQSKDIIVLVNDVFIEAVSNNVQKPSSS